VAAAAVVVGVWSGVRWHTGDAGGGSELGEPIGVSGRWSSGGASFTTTTATWSGKVRGARA
jgi:hypothetical protein